MSGSIIVFNLPGHEELGENLKVALQAESGSIVVREFPDGETYVRSEFSCKDQDVVLAANLYQPNAQVLPLMFCAKALRNMGARRIILVTPYLPYMRQDARFQPGEVVTSRLFAKLLCDIVDGVVTVDPHLHRYNTLDDLYSIPSRVCHAAAAIAKWIQSRIEQPLIVGPDEESRQWVSKVAELANAPFIVLKKTRRGDHDVRITVPPLDEWRHHTPVLVDDIISTGRTMIETMGHLDSADYSPAVCIGVHGVFSDGAYQALQDAGAADIATCKTVLHPSNQIDLTDEITLGVLDLLRVTTSRQSSKEREP